MKKETPQTPFIMKSTLTKPHRWFVVTKYKETRGMCAMGPDTGKTFDYLVAKEKFDVTDQIEAIIAASAPKPKRKKKR